MKYAGFSSLSTVDAATTERPNAGVDSRLLFVVVTLTLLGLVIVYASTCHLGTGCLLDHLKRTGAGLAALVLGIVLDHRRLGRRGWRFIVLAVTVGVLAATFVLGERVGVTLRNIRGLLQPAEFARFGLVLWLAAYFGDLRDSGRAWGFWNSFLKPLLYAAPVVLLTLLQPAAGTALMMAVSAFAVFFIAGVKKRFLVFGLAVAVLIGVVAVNVIKRNPGTKFFYWYTRLANFDNGDNYHQRQSLIAIGSGGLLGKGLGEGRQKYYFLPKLHKDFIFATVGEEFGFLGCLVVLTLYLILLWRGMAVSRGTTTSYSQYLAAGITASIFCYSLVHEAVALALIPTTGQPLPFISYGGSALVANLLGAGMLLRISRFRRTGLDESHDSSRWDRRARISRARTGA